MKAQRLSFVVMVAAVICVCCMPSTTQAGETVVYSEGFESGDGGYVLDYGSTAGWEWGSPSGSVGPGVAHSGTNCWGTNLGGTLNRPAEGSIISPPIPLPSIGTNQLIRVRFWAYVAIDGMVDRAQFFVSKDTNTWESLIQLYENMDTNPAAAPAWRKYEFTLDPSYAGTNIYLRFRAAVQSSSPSFFCGGSTDLSGFYVDDIAITVFDNPGAKKIFSMEAWEDASAWASCPWVAPWDGSEFKADNDIYSVARYPQNEYTDYYKLMKPLVAKDGVYPIEVQELETEDSFTDYLALLQVDHAPDVAVAPDGSGTLVGYRPATLVPPQSATATDGQDVLALVSVQDNSGYAAYSGDAIVVDFGNVDVSQGAALVLRVKGFVTGEGEERPYIGTPAVVVETRDAGGQWQECGRLLPRYDYTVCAFDLSPCFSNGNPVVLRLRSISHSIKYHAIDYVALQTGAQPAFTATQVAPTAASFGSIDILGKVAAADGDYFKMSSGEKFSAQFPVRPLAAGNVRDFVFVSKGYYIPKSGSYLIYTWDGSNWALRDSYNYPSTDFTKSFDLSLFLPDPNGEYRVRVWQDYQYEPAGIDQVSMTVGGLDAPLASAWDYRYASDIYSQVVSSDDIRDEWAYCPRDRVTEFVFTSPIPPNVPPTTCPVTASNTFPVISWVYNDPDGDAQAASEVQIWTGPGQTGTIVWNPPIFTGAGTSVVYSGAALAPGVYYAIVRANDGKDWGPWCEAQFVVSILNRPPEAKCKNETVPAQADCSAAASVDDGSFDPDGDPITLTQSPPGPYPLGTTAVTLSVADDKGLTNTCTATVTVVDNTPPVITCPSNIVVIAQKACGDIVPYPLGFWPSCDRWRTNASGVVVSYPAPVASDNCPGVTVACVPPSGSLFPIGVTTVTCTATDAAGNTNSCTFTIEVKPAVAWKCPLSQGYWKNHPAAWPVNALTLGSQTYTKAELLAILRTSTVGDASLILARQLIAAKLNIAYGSDPAPVSATIGDADSLLSGFAGKLPYKVSPNATTGKRMVKDAAVLDLYNNRLLTPGCRGTPCDDR